jgi:hypothetical protein
MNSYGHLLKATSHNPRHKMAVKLSDNQVFVLREKGHFCYETRPVPTLPSENQVTVAVGATGLCGSDVCTVNLRHPIPCSCGSSISSDLEQHDRSTTGAMERLASSKSDSHLFSAMNPQVLCSNAVLAFDF